LESPHEAFSTAVANVAHANRRIRTMYGLTVEGSFNEEL
jgi:hypothetical protein